MLYQFEISIRVATEDQAVNVEADNLNDAIKLMNAVVIGQRASAIVLRTKGEERL